MSELRSMNPDELEAIRERLHPTLSQSGAGNCPQVLDLDQARWLLAERDHFYRAFLETCGEWRATEQQVTDLCAALAQAQRERDELKQAITPTHAAMWAVKDCASLAAAHRDDSESVDASVVKEDRWGTTYDYDAARLKQQQKLEAAEQQADRLRVALQEIAAEMGPLEQQMLEEVGDVMQMAPRFDMANWIEDCALKVRDWRDRIAALGGQP